VSTGGTDFAPRPGGGGGGRADGVLVPSGADSGGGGATVVLRYFAAAAHAAGIEEETVDRAPDLAALLDAAVARRGDALARVLPACSVLVDGVSTVDRATRLAGVTTVDLLPPFAGG